MPIIRTLTAVAFFVLVACPVIAHHAAEGIVDEEIYAMIDAMVADTPHADLVFDDMGGGMTEIDITTPVQDLEQMVAEGLLDAVAMLDGDVTLTVDFTDRRMLSVTILQVETTEDADKAGDTAEATTLGGLKARFR